MWLGQPDRPAGAEIGGLAEELGLARELPAALNQFAGQWVEYGVLQHAPDWGQRLSRADSGCTVAYVHGQVEV